MKKFLQSLIERKRKELKDKEERMKNSQDIDEVRSLGETLIALRDEINDAEEQLKKLEEDMMAKMKVQKITKMTKKMIKQMKEEVQMDLIQMQF